MNRFRMLFVAFVFAVFTLVVSVVSASAEEFVSYRLRSGETVSEISYRFTLDGRRPAYEKLVVVDLATGQPYEDEVPYNQLWEGTEVRIPSSLVRTEVVRVAEQSVSEFCANYADSRCERVVSRLNGTDVLSGDVRVPAWKHVSTEAHAESAVEQSAQAQVESDKPSVTADTTAAQAPGMNSTSAEPEVAPGQEAAALSPSSPSESPPPEPNPIPWWPWVLLAVMLIGLAWRFDRPLRKPRLRWCEGFARGFVDMHSRHRLPDSGPPMTAGIRHRRWPLRPEIWITPGEGKEFPNLSDHRVNVLQTVERVVAKMNNRYDIGPHDIRQVGQAVVFRPRRQWHWWTPSTPTHRRAA